MKWKWRLCANSVIAWKFLFGKKTTILNCESLIQAFFLKLKTKPYSQLRIQFNSVFHSLDLNCDSQQKGFPSISYLWNSLPNKPKMPSPGRVTWKPSRLQPIRNTALIKSKQCPEPETMALSVRIAHTNPRRLLWLTHEPSPSAAFQLVGKAGTACELGF